MSPRIQTRVRRSSASRACYKNAGVTGRVLKVARESSHNKINADLGVHDNPGIKALFEFVGEAMKK
jgi:arylformamidase